MPASADRQLLRYGVESTFGTAPGGTYKALRYTSESLAPTSDSIVSREIRSDRQVTGVQRSNVGAGGSIDVELSHTAFDDFLEAVVQADATWSTPVSDITATIAATASTNVFTKTSAFGSFAVGDFIRSTGFTNAANNGVARVTAASANSITVEGLTLVTEAGGGAETIEHASTITNGTTEKTYTIEKEFTDLTNIFEQLLGCALSGVSMNAAPAGLVTGSFSVLGKSGAGATSSDASSTTAAPTNNVMNAIESGTGAIIAGSLGAITEFSFALENNLRGRQQIGTLGNVSIGSGKIAVTGSLRAYFSDLTLKDKFTNYDTIGISIIMADGSGNYLIVDLPECKFTTGDSNNSGESTDIMLNLSFSAFRDATEDVTVRFAKLGS